MFEFGDDLHSGSLDQVEPTKTTIRAERTRRGLTLESLAVGTGQSFPYLSRLERGVQRLTPAKADVLGPFLGVPPESLLAGQAELQASLRAELVGAAA